MTCRRCQRLHRRLHVAEAAAEHLTREDWRQAARSGGSLGRVAAQARVYQLEKAVARAMATLSDPGMITADAASAFETLEGALGDPDWRDLL